MKKLFSFFTACILISTFAVAQQQKEPDWKSLKVIQKESNAKLLPRVAGSGFILSSPVLFNQEGFALNTCPSVVTVSVRAVDDKGKWDIIQIEVTMDNSDKMTTTLDYFRYATYPIRIPLVQQYDAKTYDFKYNGLFATAN